MFPGIIKLNLILHNESQNVIILRCGSADDNDLNPAATFDFTNVLGNNMRSSPPTRGEILIDMESENDLIIRCYSERVASLPIAITSQFI